MGDKTAATLRIQSEKEGQSQSQWRFNADGCRSHAVAAWKCRCRSHTAAAAWKCCCQSHTAAAAWKWKVLLPVPHCGGCSKVLLPVPHCGAGRRAAGHGSASAEECRAEQVEPREDVLEANRDFHFSKQRYIGTQWNMLHNIESLVWIMRMISRTCWVCVCRDARTVHWSEEEWESDFDVCEVCSSSMLR